MALDRVIAMEVLGGRKPNSGRTVQVKSTGFPDRLEEGQERRKRQGGLQFGALAMEGWDFCHPSWSTWWEAHVRVERSAVLEMLGLITYSSVA